MLYIVVAKKVKPANDLQYNVIISSKQTFDDRSYLKFHRNIFWQNEPGVLLLLQSQNTFASKYFEGDTLPSFHVLWLICCPFEKL